MVLPKTVLSAALIGAASGAVVPRAFSVPSDNGFPNPNDQQEMAIAEQAGGKLPNGPPPKSLGAGSTTAFQLIAFNELFETAFFQSLVNNITSGEYKAPDGSLAEFQAVVAQEQQHALGAISTLKAAGKFAPGPCKYMFPTTTFEDAVGLAETFTAVVLGALQGANVLFAKDGATDPVQLVSSVIGQEGEQNGYYRSLLDRIPSESPFLTYVPAPFAFSALQMFVVKDSCPFPLKDIPIPILPPIMTNGGAVALIEPNDQELTFTADLSGNDQAKKYVGGNGDGLYLTYTTGQQLPFSVKPQDVKWQGSTITFKANFPYKEYVMHGFSHGAITTTDTFANGDAVADAALAGPAVIQVNNKL